MDYFYISSSISVITLKNKKLYIRTFAGIEDVVKNGTVNKIQAGIKAEPWEFGSLKLRGETFGHSG